MSWFLITLLLLNLSLINFSEARNVKNLPSAVVVGTVYCDTCFQRDFSKTSHFIEGATIAVDCKDNSASKSTFRQEAKTDKHGEFKVHLPFSVSKHVKKIEGCSVKLIKSSQPYCAVASSATSYSLHLKSKKQGTHIFTSGFFTFNPLNQPNVCNQKPSIHNSKEFETQKTFLLPGDAPALPTPIQNPTIPNLPPIYQNLPPLPQLPFLPPLPQLPPLPPLSSLPKQNIQISKELNFYKTFFSPKEKQRGPNIPPIYHHYLPPLPKLPDLPHLPQLPHLPSLPGFPRFPPTHVGKNTETKSKENSKNNEKVDKKEFNLEVPISLPLNPLEPPQVPEPLQPLPLIPNPFQPPPSPTEQNLP